MKKKLSYYIGITAILAFIVLFAYFSEPIFTPQIENPYDTKAFWETDLNQENQLTVFNLTLDKSTLNEAVYVFGNRLNLSIFEENNQLLLEGYFRETRVGKIFTGRIAVSFASDNQEFLSNQIKTLEKNKLSTSTKSIYEIPPDQITNFNNYVIHSIAFIPIAIRLSENDILNRFGTPEHVIAENNNIKHYLYNRRGINIAIDRTGKNSAVIQYINPQYFDEKVLNPLLKKPKS